MRGKKTTRQRATSAPQLGQINNIVVVILEKPFFRSYARLLVFEPGECVERRATLRGLTGNESNPDGKGGRVKIFPSPANAKNPYFYLGANCGEGYLNTNSQLFGTNQAPVPVVPATNTLRHRAADGAGRSSSRCRRRSHVDRPRKDDPLAGVKVPVAESTPKLSSAPDHLEMALAEAAERLPFSEESSAGHKHDLPHFESGEQSVAYARARYAAYKASKQRK